MSRKNKHKNQPTPVANQSSRQKETANRHVYVEPGVQIDLVKDLRHEYESANTESTAHNRKQLGWTIVTACLVFIYTGIAAYQLKTARDTFNASNRPYIGIDASTMIHFLKSDSGEWVQAPDGRPNSKTERMAWQIQVKNFGPVPGINYREMPRVFLDGVEKPAALDIHGNRATVFPGQVVLYGGSASGDTYQRIMNGKSVLLLEIAIEYDGPHGHTKYCERREYYPVSNGFYMPGECD